MSVRGPKASHPLAKGQLHLSLSIDQSMLLDSQFGFTSCLLLSPKVLTSFTWD